MNSHQLLTRADLLIGRVHTLSTEIELAMTALQETLSMLAKSIPSSSTTPNNSTAVENPSGSIKEGSYARVQALDPFDKGCLAIPAGELVKVELILGDYARCVYVKKSANIPVVGVIKVSCLVPVHDCANSLDKTLDKYYDNLPGNDFTEC